HVLPLRTERSSTERAIETVTVLSAVAKANELDIVPKGFHGFPKGWRGTATVRLDELARAALDDALALERTAKAEKRAEAKKKAESTDQTSGNESRVKPTEVASGTAGWTALAEFLFDWDEKIQDLMAIRSPSCATGYQLGKGFA